MKRVVIHWLDIHTDHGWEAVDKAVNLTPAECQTIGFIVGETPDYIVVSATYSKADEIEETNSRTSIPKGCIVRTEELD